MGRADRVLRALHCFHLDFFTPAWSERSLKVENGTGPEFFLPSLPVPLQAPGSAPRQRQQISSPRGSRTQTPGNRLQASLIIFSRRSAGGFTKVASVLTVTHLNNWWRHKTTEGSVFTHSNPSSASFAKKLLSDLFEREKRHLQWRPLWFVCWH